MLFRSSLNGVLEHRWFVIVVAFFAVVYAASLTFVYVEGDDASSIAYHLYGHSSTVQPPYSPYHSMMDMVLSILPINESLLRVAAITMTNIAAVGLVIFILALTFHWLKDYPLPPKWVIALVVLLASPEFFYLGLVYLPSVIAMSLVLLAHLMLRVNRHDKITLILSALVFGIGGGCRWDITTYGAVIAADLLLGFGAQAEGLRTRIQRCIAWGGLALVCFFIVIAVTGYEPSRVLSETQKYSTYVAETGRSWLNTIAAIQPLVTPAFALFLVAGLVALIRRRSPLLVIMFVGVVVVLPWVSRGVPKFVLPAIPVVVACAVLGFALLWQRFRQTPVRLAIVGLVAAPWLIGVKTTNEGTGWGPGFELRRYDYAVTEGTQLSIAPGAGALFPTSEGPRVLFGHAAVLLGGEWRRFVNQQQQEIETVTDYIIQTQRTFLHTSHGSQFVIALWVRGYVTSDPRDVPDEQVVRRTFTNAAGDIVTMVRREISETALEQLFELEDLGQIVIYGYPRTLRRMYEVAPDALESLGTQSAILDFPMLLQKLRQAS